MKNEFTTFLLIVEAVRKNRRTAVATDADIQEEVVRYLHGASDRKGGKKERLEKRRLSKRNE